MRPVYLALALAISAEPPLASDLVKQALGRVGAVITSAQRLGNQALVFSFELRGEQLSELRPALREIGSLLDQTEAKLEQAERTVPPTAEVVGSLHVTLMHNAPDERVELPRVPG